MANNTVNVVGGGLAGCEAAWQIAKQGVQVRLFEMRPNKMTPAHHTENLAELVCSNSLRSNALENAVGLLKEEMRQLDSLIMSCADAHSVPAGSALAVDRHQFSRAVSEKISAHPNIEVIRQEITNIPSEGITVIATGPLTSEELVQDILKLTGADDLHFFDAAAPIVTGDSINYDVAFWASRYDKGEADYLNCPMTQEEYERFYHELIHAEVYQLKEFEQNAYFEGCMPVEVMAKRGPQTLLFGPLKPVGLSDPRTGEKPYAVIQLRKENTEASLFNLVGFQTSLKWSEQKRVFRMIPGLEEAEFVRYGVIHRNTFITSFKVLRPTMQTIENPYLFFAGQLTGVEGYVESASNGLVAGINAGRVARGLEPIVFPPETAHGALCRYITTPHRDFQPMNITFGLMPSIPERIKDKHKKKMMISERALEIIQTILKIIG